MREEVFDQRLARYYDELKWLYCELYNNDTQAFDYFMKVLRDYYTERRCIEGVGFNPRGFTGLV